MKRHLILVSRSERRKQRLAEKKEGEGEGYRKYMIPLLI